MAAGTPLSDADRAGWLQALADKLRAAHAAGCGVVLSCSALKRRYRDQLRQGAPGLVFVHLAVDAAVLAERVASRAHRYMPASLLASQLAALEAPAPEEGAITVDGASGFDRIVPAVLQRLAATPSTTPISPAMATFTQVILHTDTDGRARFREQAIELSEGTPMSRLSPLAPSGGYQLRESPVGFRSDFHCTGSPQWLFVLRGAMEIGLQDGSTRVFRPGDHFYSADTLPEGATFDPTLHGHCRPASSATNRS